MPVFFVIVDAITFISLFSSCLLLAATNTVELLYFNLVSCHLLNSFLILVIVSYISLDCLCKQTVKNLLKKSANQFSCSVVSDFLWPHGMQHTRPPFPSPTPGVYSNSCPLSRWCYPTISTSVIPFSSCLQSFPAYGSFPMSQLFASGGQNIGASASASILPMNIQDWFPLGWTGWISLQSKGPSRVFSNTTVQKHQFFSAQLS